MLKKSPTSNETYLRDRRAIFGYAGLTGAPD
jgi:hypothetical protein